MQQVRLNEAEDAARVAREEAAAARARAAQVEAAVRAKEREADKANRAADAARAAQTSLELQRAQVRQCTHPSSLILRAFSLPSWLCMSRGTCCELECAHAACASSLHMLCTHFLADAHVPSLQHTGRGGCARCRGGGRSPARAPCPS